MQTLIQVFGNASGSLRDRIVNDARLKDYDLYVAAYKKQSRSHGWSKLRLNGGHGAMNIHWDAASCMLICRVVTRGGEPSAITGAFVKFLLARLRKQIALIHILPGQR
jgi:hypothetical protein